MARQHFLKHIFLTYAQCPVPPVALLDHLKCDFDIERICISQETHQDGNPHLHCYMEVKERLVLNKTQFATAFDLDYDIEGYWHPNVQAARNKRKVIEYVCKGLTNGNISDFIEWPSPFSAAAMAKKAPKNDKIAKLIIDGKSVKEAFDEEPGFVGFNLDKVMKLHSWYQLNSQPVVQLQQWQLLDLAQYPLNSPAYAIALWLNTNIHAQRPSRTKHLMLIGPTQLGKSYLIRCLKNFLRPYICPNEGPYFAPWENGKYDFIALEELHAGWKLQTLLLFLDGCPMNLKVHGGFNFKNENVPVIITTNQSFRESYKNSQHAVLEALESRVTIVNLFEQLDVFPGLIPLFD